MIITTRNLLIYSLIILFTGALFFQIKDLSGLNHQQQHDIRDHWVVAQTLFQAGELTRYDPGPEEMYAPPLMHVITGAYVSLTESGFDFFTYRDSSYILWSFLWSGLAVLIFLMLHFYGVSMLSAAVTALGLVLLTDHYHLTRWFGLMQFLGVITLAIAIFVVSWQLKFELRNRSKFVLLTVAHLLILLSHYTSILFWGWACAFALGFELVYRRQLLTNTKVFIASGVVSLLLAFIFFYRKAIPDWGRKFLEGSESADLLFQISPVLLLLGVVIYFLALSIAGLCIYRPAVSRFFSIHPNNVLYVNLLLCTILTIIFFQVGGLILQADQARSMLGLFFARSSIFSIFLYLFPIAFVLYWFKRVHLDILVSLVLFLIGITFFYSNTDGTYQEKNHALSRSVQEPGPVFAPVFPHKFPLLDISDKYFFVRRMNGYEGDILLELQEASSEARIQERVSLGADTGSSVIASNLLNIGPPGQYRLLIYSCEDGSCPSRSLVAYNGITIWSLSAYLLKRIIYPGVFTFFLIFPLLLVYAAQLTNRTLTLGGHFRRPDEDS